MKTSAGGGGVERKATSAHAAPAPASHLRKLGARVARARVRPAAWRLLTPPRRLLPPSPAEESSDTFAHATVGLDLRLAIQQARLAKKMSQKDLAAACAEKATVINAYEAGSAVPNGAIIAKMERVLGVRLPRPVKVAAK